MCVLSSSDESDEEFDDDTIGRIVLVTQLPRRHQGGDRTSTQTTKHRITSDLAHVINDGLYYYEQVSMCIMSCSIHTLHICGITVCK